MQEDHSHPSAKPVPLPSVSVALFLRLTEEAFRCGTKTRLPQEPIRHVFVVAVMPGRKPLVRAAPPLV